MGIARAITRVHGIFVFLILVACIGLSVFGLDAWMIPKVRQGADFVIHNFDSYVPAISLRGGKASIKKAQPYFIDLGDVGEGLVMVIDTRPGEEKNALDYLKDAKVGVVLSRDSLVTKNRQQIRIIPLKGIPDAELNSRTIRLLFERFFPIARAGTAVALAVWYFFAKLTQVLLLALIPLIWARAASTSVGYGACVKLAAVAMVPLVLLDLVFNLADVRVPGGFFVHWLAYLALYILVMILASLSLASGSRKAADPQAAIEP